VITVDSASVALSRASRGGVLWFACAAVAAVAQRSARPIAETAAATVTATGASTALSHVIGRKRPCRGAPALIDCPDSPSLPSNHAAAATAAALTLGRRVPALRAPLAAAALAVGWSRVRCGVHYTSDTVAGGVVGVVVDALVLRASEKLSSR
jgi:membrane-associated phospholipid phosphatase